MKQRAKKQIKKITKLVFKLLRSGHPHITHYGLGAFGLALEELYEDMSETLKNTSIAARIAYFADDDAFKDFIDVNQGVCLDEVENFSL